MRVARQEQGEVGGGERKKGERRGVEGEERRPRRKGGGARALTRGGFRALRPRVGLAASCLVWSEDTAVPGPAPTRPRPTQPGLALRRRGKAEFPQAPVSKFPTARDAVLSRLWGPGKPEATTPPFLNALRHQGREFLVAGRLPLSFQNADSRILSYLPPRLRESEYPGPSGTVRRGGGPPGRPGFRADPPPPALGPRLCTFRPLLAAPPSSLGPAGTETSRPRLRSAESCLGVRLDGRVCSSHARGTGSPGSYWVTSPGPTLSGEQPGWVTSLPAR